MVACAVWVVKVVDSVLCDVRCKTIERESGWAGWCPSLALLRAKLLKSAICCPHPVGCFDIGCVGERQAESDIEIIEIFMERELRTSY